jgi:hypothetical protein
MPGRARPFNAGSLAGVAGIQLALLNGVIESSVFTRVKDQS